MSLSDCSVFNVNAIPDIFNVQRRIFLPPCKIHLYLRLRQVKPCRMSQLSMGTFLIIACYGPIVYCHISIFRSVRQHNKHNIQMANSRSEQNKRVNMQVDEMKVTKLLFAIVLAFTCCWSALIVIDGVSMFTGKYWMPREVYMTYTYLVGYSSSVNPVIYRIFNPQLRQELCQLPSFRRTRRVGAQ